MELQEHPHRSAKITILANVTEPRTLQWKDPYSKEIAPESFTPKMDPQTGATVYEVPFAYAERLLRGEPNKYKLLSPKRVKMNFPTQNGGFERRDVFHVVPKLDYLKTIEISGGIPVFRELTFQEKQEVIAYQAALARGINPENLEKSLTPVEVRKTGILPKAAPGRPSSEVKKLMLAKRAEEEKQTLVEEEK